MRTETIIGSVTAITGVIALYYLMRGGGTTVYNVPALSNNQGDRVSSPTVSNPIPAYAASNFAPSHDYSKAFQSTPVSSSDCGCGNFDPCSKAKPITQQTISNGAWNLQTSGNQPVPVSFPTIPTYQSAPQLPPGVPVQHTGTPWWLLPHVQGYA